MPVNLLEQACRTSSDKAEFGLCDDPPPPGRPAYVDESGPNKWIGLVKNPSGKEVEFYAVDHCVEVLKPDGSLEKRCDGILQYEQNLVFVELKDRAARGWLGDAREQIEASSRVFAASARAGQYASIRAQVCNRQRPFTTPNYTNEIQKFRNSTGLVLRVERTIQIY